MVLCYPEISKYLIYDFIHLKVVNFYELEHFIIKLGHCLKINFKFVEYSPLFIRFLIYYIILRTKVDKVNYNFIRH